MQNYRGQNLRDGYRGNFRNKKTLEEVEVGLEKDSIQVILEEMSKVVAGLDQV